MAAASALRAAIIGASGIGKHHAKWLHALGVEVAAIVGTSPASVQKAGDVLRDLFPFSGRGYLSVPEMLAAEDPDLVHVCSPPGLHHEHVLALAPHRCHVMCEKPLTGDDGKTAEQLLVEAAEMTEAVSAPGRVAAVNLQYAALPAAYAAHAAVVGWPPEPPRRFFMHMDSRRPTNTYEIIWRELGPHALSALAAFCGPGQVRFDKLRMTIAERRSQVCFVYSPTDGPDCDCELVVGNVPQGPLTRRFGVNNRLVDYEGRNDQKGVFRAYLRSDDTETESDDFMYLSMRQMVRACQGHEPRPLATMSEGLENQRLQLQIVARGRRVN